VFAASGDTVWLAVDAKPKRTTQLQRLTNLRREPRCALLVDHYEEEWSRLWWGCVPTASAWSSTIPTPASGD